MMDPKQKQNKVFLFIKKNISLIILIVVVEIFAILIFSFIKNVIEHKYKENILMLNRIQYNQLYSSYKLITLSLYNDLIQEYKIIPLLHNINNVSEAEQDIIRNQLYVKLNGFYNRHSELFNLRQLHFHLSNNISFLRFHKPSKYGDDLSDIRETVNYVNKMNIKIDGFEEGRIFNGFRYIYPLTSDTNYHIGSVEISLSIKAFISKFQQLSINEEYDFFIKKDIVDKKVWNNLKELNYIHNACFPNYYREKNIFHKYSILFKKFDKDQLSLIRNNLNNDKDFIFNLQEGNKYYITTFLAIKNPITDKVVSYIVIKNRSNELFILNIFYNIAIGLSLIISFIILYFLIRNRKSKLELFDLANIDFLTGIYNRRYFFIEATKRLRKNIIHNESVSLIMLDIDHFKKVNDNYNHDIGDIVLKSFTNVISDKLDEKSIFARIGGEEFVIFTNLPFSTLETKMKECKDAIENMEIKTSKGIIKITTSVGYTTLEAKDNNIDDLLHKSDIALYQSKDSGRNTVSRYLRKDKKS